MYRYSGVEQIASVQVCPLGWSAPLLSSFLFRDLYSNFIAYFGTKNILRMADKLTASKVLINIDPDHLGHL